MEIKQFRITAGKSEYLKACAQSLKGETSKLHTAWVSGPNPYGAILKSAGELKSSLSISKISFARIWLMELSPLLMK